MDHAELETIATDLHIDPSAPLSSSQLARRLFGADAIIRPPSLVGAYPACTFVANGRRQIAIRRTVPANEVGFFIAHEIAHAVLGRPHGHDEDIESLCDYLGAAIVAPRASTVALYRAFGWNVKAIAGVVRSTQTWAALRLGEVLREPVAALSPERVRVRGPEEWEWGSEENVRRVARSRGPGITKIRITDRPRRTAFRCASDPSQ